ncbi:hypothetical protein [Pseudomonas putida]|nr:hypothetical protein [Pseudomonas putida]
MADSFWLEDHGDTDCCEPSGYCDAFEDDQNACEGKDYDKKQQH